MEALAGEEWKKTGETPPPAECAQLVAADHGAKRATANRGVNGVGAFATWVIEKRPHPREVSCRGRSLVGEGREPFAADALRLLHSGTLATFMDAARPYDAVQHAVPGMAVLVRRSHGE